jgi:leucyl-tRNA synthetase
VAEELWEKLGHAGTLAYAPWPACDASLLVQDTIEIAIQVNGKVRGRISIPAGADPATVLAAAKADAGVGVHLEGKTVRKEIVVPGKLVNIVVG